jgi:hypothetical protein
MSLLRLSKYRSACGLRDPGLLHGSSEDNEGCQDSFHRIPGSRPYVANSMRPQHSCRGCHPPGANSPAIRPPSWYNPCVSYFCGVGAAPASGANSFEEEGHGQEGSATAAAIPDIRPERRDMRGLRPECQPRRYGHRPIDLRHPQNGRVAQSATGASRLQARGPQADRVPGGRLMSQLRLESPSEMATQRLLSGLRRRHVPVASRSDDDHSLPSGESSTPR